MGLTGFINPGIGIIKSWQGITEIAIRAALIIMALIMAAAGGGCQSTVGQTGADARAIETVGLTDSAGGWLIFMGIIIIIYEAVVIAQRFLNVVIINQNITIVIIIDIAFNFVIAGLIFCAAVALAVYIPRWQVVLANPGNDAFSRGVLERVIGSSGAAAAFAFLTMFLLIGMGVFMLVGGLVLSWGPTKAKYEGSSGSSGAV